MMAPVLLLAAAETWWGVLGGLIPIIGLGLIGFVIWRSVHEPDDENDEQ